MTDAHDAIARYRSNLQDEIDSAALYRALAEAERSPELREVFQRLATMEEHVRFWEQKLRELGVPLPQLRPSWRTRVLIAIARHWGAALVLPTVTARE